MSNIKIFNDPIYGFVRFPGNLPIQIIDHPYFQRLRYIRQLGLAHLVYPGALHTRFHHALGAAWLSSSAVNSLRAKGIAITSLEEEALVAAVLLHDVGHGPYSHSLEYELVENVSHEQLTLHIMNRLSTGRDECMNTAIAIFKNEYPKKFLHELISSQLDVDRLDYLRRDSYYTGVQEGAIGSERIIELLNVSNQKLVVEAKGIYSVESYLLARRVMYWQVYLHKAVVGAELLLIRIIRRAKELKNQSYLVNCSEGLDYFLNRNSVISDENSEQLLENYLAIDDNDVTITIKNWQKHSDFTLSTLSKYLIQRQLLHVDILENEPDNDLIESLQLMVSREFKISMNEAAYFVFCEPMGNTAYNKDALHINILQKQGVIKAFNELSLPFQNDVLTLTQTKYFLCYPKQFIVKD
ncbi:MAG: HD domain-containing protein [Bacteroidota bacterium]|nr:HD domain-containing protein [Bacteroidota bacterium]